MRVFARWAATPPSPGAAGDRELPSGAPGWGRSLLQPRVPV